MSEQMQSKFEGWAVVELMGHQREIGFVATEYFGGAALFRIDTPELLEESTELKSPQWIGDALRQAGTKVMRPAVPGKTRFVAPGALYALNPCTEEAARKELSASTHRPIKLVGEGGALLLIDGGPSEEEDDGDHDDERFNDHDHEGKF